MNGLRAAILRGARAGAPHGAGAHAPRPGEGWEFVRLRGYAEGDDPRRIDWAATARSGALQTRVLVDETVLVLAALVDESPSMRAGRRRGLDVAAREALAAWIGAADAGDRVARLIDGRVLAERRAAVAARAQDRFDLGAGLAFAARVLPRHAALLVVTDGFDPAAEDEPLLARVGARLDATVLLAADPWAAGLPLRGFVRLRDAEGRGARTVFVTRRGRERYAAASAQRSAALGTRFARAGWRVGALDERDGRAALARTFGLA